MSKSPVAALKDRVEIIDGAVFEEGRLPTIAEWSEVAELVARLVDEDEMPAAQSAPSPSTSSNVIAFPGRRH